MGEVLRKKTLIEEIKDFFRERQSGLRLQRIPLEVKEKIIGEQELRRNRELKGESS